MELKNTPDFQGLFIKKIFKSSKLAHPWTSGYSKFQRLKVHEVFLL